MSPRKPRRRAVIRRWVGCAAYCPDCHKPVPLDGDHTEAYRTATQVRDALREGLYDEHDTLGDAVRALCQTPACQARRTP